MVCVLKQKLHEHLLVEKLPSVVDWFGFTCCFCFIKSCFNLLCLFLEARLLVLHLVYDEFGESVATATRFSSVTCI